MAFKVLVLFKLTYRALKAVIKLKANRPRCPLQGVS